MSIIKGFIKRIIGGGDSKVKRDIIINAETLETRVAVLENGRLEEFQIEHPTEARLVGSIFKGRILNLENDLQASFVDIGMKKNAFLHYWDMNPDDDSRLDDTDDDGHGKQRQNSRRRFTNEDIARRHPPGSVLTVQVSKDAIGTKGPRVTASLSIPGRYLVLLPGCTLRGVSRKIGDAEERARLKSVLERLPLPPNCGIIVRTAAVGVSKRSFVRDLRVILTAYEDLQNGIAQNPTPSCVYAEPDLIMRVIRDWLTEDVDRIIVDNPEVYEKIRAEAGRISRHAKGIVQLYEGHQGILSHYGVERQIDEAFRRKVALPSGGHLVFDETEALVAIDVNTGRYKGRGSQEEAILDVNTEAVEEIARQLRLRNIGGLVVLDLVDMKSRRHQQAVYKAFKAAIARDKARTNVLPISELGIMEMTRQRQEESVLSQMHQDCPYCHGRGSIKSALQLSVDIQRQLSTIIRRAKVEKRTPDIQVCVHPSVLDRLRTDDEQIIMLLQQSYEGKFSFKSDPLRMVESFAILETATGKVLFAAGDQKPV
ncbi:MAG: Rne/Rng family ribonuclease [Kiritimatiellaeota bacterium]|nr:Rne/Rng family ribonuclease [Kiritimatiellota bacterium]